MITEREITSHSRADCEPSINATRDDITGPPEFARRSEAPIEFFRPNRRFKGHFATERSKNRFFPSKVHPVNVIQRAAKAVVEVLEGRVLLAAHTWTGLGPDSNWSDASNWTGGAPSAAESNVTLDFPSGVSNSSAINDISGLTIQAITVEGSYSIWGTPFTLDGSVSTSGSANGGLDNDITLGANSTFNCIGQLNLGGVISGGYNISVSGTVYLSGSNTYTGTTTVTSGLLYLGSNNALGTGAGGAAVDTGAAIMLDLGLSVNEPLTISGTGSGGYANAALFPREAQTSSYTTTATWSGPVTFAGNTAIAGRPASDGGVHGVQSTLAITGSVSGTGNLTIANGGVTLAGVNHYTGATIVNAGTLTLQSPGQSVLGNLIVNGGSVETKLFGQLAPTSAVSLAAAGTTFTIDSGDTETVSSLTGSGTLNGAGRLIDQTNGTDLFSGALNGSVSFMLNGNGELFLDGSATDSTTGQITLAQGDLIVNANMPNAPLLQTGGELGGGGSVARFTSTGGNMQLGSFNPGILTTTGPVDLAAGSTFDFIAADGSNYTGIASAGAVTIAGNLAIAGLGSGYTPAAGTGFDVVHNTSSSPVSGTFNAMPEGDIITYQNGNWRLSYLGGDGNDVTLTYLGLPNTITAGTNAATAPLGQVVLHASVVSGVRGAPTPIGNVTFKNGSIVLGTVALDNSGNATFAATGLPVGSYTLTAYYDGDTVFETTGPSSGVSQTVTQVSSTLGLNASSASVAAGAPVTLTASVSSGGIPVVPTGTVTFFSNGTAIGTVSVDGSGNATLASSSLEAGQDVVTANYSGDVNFGSSSATPEDVTVTPSVSFGNVTTTKAASSGTASFVATLDAPSNLPVTVNYITQDGTAMATRDYLPSSGTVTFAPGETSKTITVPLVGGTNWEPVRTFRLIDSSPANATLSVLSATATIQSQDGMPAAGLIPDELDPNQNDLVVYAPAGNNAIQVKTTKIGQVQVVVDRTTVATDSGIDRVIVYGGTGNTTLTVSPRIGAGVIFFGGQGRSVATGGGGNDILVGGSGPNLLAGGGGMNLLVGGVGNATLLHGSGAGDVLVGGPTEYDSGTLSDLMNLESLLAAWTAPGAYADRAAALAASNAPDGATLNSSSVVFNPHDHAAGRKNRDLVLAQAPTKVRAAAR